MQFFAPKWSNAVYFLIVSSQLDWTSTWAPTGTVFLTYVVTLFFGINFLLKITTGIWHQSTSARSWFYSSTLDHRCAFACVLCMWSITVCLRMNTWNITCINFFPRTLLSLWWTGCVQFSRTRSSSTREIHRVNWWPDTGDWQTLVMAQLSSLLGKQNNWSRNCLRHFGPSLEKKLVSCLLYENCLLYALRWPPS